MKQRLDIKIEKEGEIVWLLNQRIFIALIFLNKWLSTSTYGTSILGPQGHKDRKKTIFQYQQLLSLDKNYFSGYKEITGGKCTPCTGKQC